MLRDGRLEAAPFVVRVYATATPDGMRIMPGGFARISDRADARAISMGQGARTADVWVVGDAPVPRVTLLGRILRKRGVETPVILTSGHTQQISPEALAALGNIVLEPKPFNIAHLLEAIHDLLTFSASVPTLAE